MTISLYDITVPVFVRGLDTLATILDKGRDHAAAAGIDPADLLQARLAPDMFTLVGQVQRASDTAKFAAVRLAGVPNTPFPDEEVSFADLAARIARTRAFLQAVPPEAFVQNAAETVTLRIGGTRRAFAPRDYLLQFALPNFFFHVTTAYDLLRHRGVSIGKADFLGAFD